jgi:hypothetical protein
MRILTALLIAGALASSASAGLDPDSDSFGVYFDTEGNTICTTAGAFQEVTAYLILMNPSAPVNGFECTVPMTGAAHFILSVDHCAPFIDCDDCAGPYSFALGCPSVYQVPANSALVLVTWRLMLQAPTELLFHIGPGLVPSLPGGLPVVTGNGVLRQCRVASGDVSLPVAGINVVGNCPVSDEASSFGTVKSLFR